MVATSVVFSRLAVLGACILSVALVAPANAGSDRLTFISNDPFSISPFAMHQLNDDGKVLNRTRTLPITIPDNLWSPGQERAAWWTDEAANANGAQCGVEFREDANAAVTIPLPPAVWTGVSGLGGLYLLNALRRRAV